MKTTRYIKTIQEDKGITFKEIEGIGEGNNTFYPVNYIHVPGQDFSWEDYYHVVGNLYLQIQGMDKDDEILSIEIIHD